MSEKSGSDAEPDSMANEADDSYYIEGEFDLMGHLTACSKCGRKILVEMGLVGVPHHVGVSVTCGECLVLSGQARKEHPQIAAKIERWLHGAQENKQERSGSPRL